MAGQRESSLFDVDADEFLAGLEKAFNELNVQSVKGLQKVGIQVANRAKAFCPVATGRLRAAIGSTGVMHDEIGAYIEVGVLQEIANKGQATAAKRMASNAAKGKKTSKKTAAKAGSANVNYGVFVEFGTSKMKAQPFLRPALAEVAGYVGPMLTGNG